MAVHPSPLVSAATEPAPEPGRRGQDRRAEHDGNLTRGLAGYVAAIAAALDVSVEATASEVTDTATAYLALAVRTKEHPGRDLMLVWSEQRGWRLAVETDPTEQPAVLAYLGADLVPEPRTVAGFVRDVLAGGPAAGRTASWEAEESDRAGLGGRLARYVAG
jgi:hypothetical protein